jgi:Mn-dependent DtxR family transcriptional regulator
MTQLTFTTMREMIALEKSRQERFERIVSYLGRAKEAKSIEAIIEMFPATSENELAEMARLGLILYIPRRKYTKFTESKNAR